MYRIKILLLLGAVALLALVPMSHAFAQSAQCEQTYIVQSGDWLSTIAQKFLGDVNAYDAIVTATNLAAKTDSSFTAITDPNKIEVGQKVCIPAANAVPGHESAGIYTAVGPAADASALVETLVLGGDGQARYIMNYVGKAEIPAKGNWKQEGTTVTVSLYEQAGKPTQQTMTFNVQDGNLVATNPPNTVYAKTAPGVSFYSGLYTANRKSFDGSQTLNALTLLPNMQAQMSLTNNTDQSFVLQTGTWEPGTDKDTNAPIITVHLTKQNEQTIDETYVFQVQGENLRGIEYNRDMWGTDLTFTKYHAPVEPETPASAQETPTPAPGGGPNPSGALLPITGQYSAHLPAADAVERVIVLDLAQDNTATMTTQFVGKGEPIVEKGTWSNETGDISVVLADSSGKQTLVFKFDGGALVLQDPEQAGYGSTGLTLARVNSPRNTNAEHGGVSLTVNYALAKQANGETLPAVPVQEGPALGGASPAAIRFLFDGAQAPNYFDPHLAQVLVYKTDDWVKLDSSTAASVDALKKMLQDKPATFEKGIPVLPPIPAAQVFQVKPQYYDFQNGTGIGFITHYAQDVSPVLASHPFYTYQGLTNDGKYYIAVFYPVTTALLPTDPNAAMGGKSYEEWAKDYDAYLTKLVQDMNGLIDAAYTPDLSLIQDMVKSINVSDTTLQ